MEQKCILLAENDPETTRFIQNALDDKGFFVETVSEGNKAWELLQTGVYDLLICDEGLPGVGGLELAGRARNEPPFRQHRGQTHTGPDLGMLAIILIVDKTPEMDPGFIFARPYERLVDQIMEQRDLTEVAMWADLFTRENTSASQYLI